MTILELKIQQLATKKQVCANLLKTHYLNIIDPYRVFSEEYRNNELLKRINDEQNN